MMKSRLTITIVAVGALALTGCMEDSKSGATGSPAAAAEVSVEQKVIETITTDVIVSTYADLKSETRKLADLSKVLQTHPTQANLEAAQTQWKVSRVPWESTEGFLFGPVDSLGVDPAIDSWPLSKVDLDQILATRANIDVDFVRQLGTDVQGFHTAEYLLFGDGVVTNTKTIAEMTPAQLQYLTAVTEVLAEQTAKLYTAWTEKHDPTDASSKAFATILLKPGTENEFYPSRSAVFQELVQGMIKIAVEVGTGKIAGPMGGDVSTADPSLVESQFSWNSLTDFQNNIVSMRNIYLGGKGKVGFGLSSLVAKKNPALDAKIRGEIDAAEAAIGAIAGTEGWSFTVAIKDETGRARSRAAIETLAKLEATLTQELLPVFQ